MRLPQAEQRARCADGGDGLRLLTEELVLLLSFLSLSESQIYMTLSISFIPFIFIICDFCFVFLSPSFSIKQVSPYSKTTIKNRLRPQKSSQ